MRRATTVLALAAVLAVAVLILVRANRSDDPALRAARRDAAPPAERPRPEAPAIDRTARGPARRSPEAQPVVEDRKEEEKPYRVAEETGDPEHAVLRVRVVDGTGRPVPDADVSTTLSIDNVGTSGPKARTDAAGLALFPDLKAEEVIAVGAQRGKHRRWCLLKLQNGRATEIEIALVSGVVVEGTVVHEAKGPLKGVTVNLDRQDGSFRDAFHVTTDELGAFRQEDVPPGTYKLGLSGRDLLYHEQQQGELAVAAPGPVRRDIVLGYLSMHGVVRDAVTKRLLAGAEVNPSGPMWAKTTADADGAYLLTSLADGTYTVLVKHDGYGLRWFREVAIRRGEPLQRDFELQPATTVHIYFLEADGSPAPGEHWLDLEGPDGGWSCNLFPDANGCVVYEHVVPGEWTFRARSGRRTTERVAARIDASARNEVRLRFEAPAAEETPSVRGTVVDARTKRPIQGVHLYVAAGLRRDAYTDAAGAFALAGLPPGSCRLYVRCDGYEQRTLGGVKVESGKTTTLDIELEPAAALLLRVTDATGRPVRGDVYFGYRLLPDGPGSGLRLEADENGCAAFRSIPVGRVSLRASLGTGRAIARTEMEILPGENRWDARLEPPEADR